MCSYMPKENIRCYTNNRKRSSKFEYKLLIVFALFAFESSWLAWAVRYIQNKTMYV